MDNAIDIGDLLGEDIPQIEDPSAAGTSIARGEKVHEENSGDQGSSSDSFSSESNDEEVVPKTSDNSTSSNSS